MPSTKIAQMVLLHQVKWPKQLKIEKYLIYPPLNHWSKLKIISQESSPKCPLPKLHKWFGSTEQMDARDKIKILKRHLLNQIQNNFTEMILIMPSTKIHKCFSLVSIYTIGTLMVFLRECFENINFEEKNQQTTKACKITQHAKSYVLIFTVIIQNKLHTKLIVKFKQIHFTT